ncbi:hypothetical protein [Alkalibacterium olivapovliticus]|uniref:Uncharacterized protein n=1 Tax=Alkalibacterium olivapovliticus TaxID=99907 RepID=A0A2T0WAF0_9LACT|nr:hypothetical protein [Alkalibacterium olivapovliticus]PRY83606.1 hypothetical protein CLV38_10329 [Alkalibacterium olivapovliticus]
MKKLSVVLVALLIAFAGSGTVYANETEENDGTVEGLYNNWETNGYPDNVGYVVMHEDQETFIIGLVENDDVAQDEILSQIPESDNVAFEEATYSYNELLAVHGEVGELVRDDETPVYSAGMGFRVVDGEVTGFGESGNEIRVTVGVEPEFADEYADQLEAEYGDRVHIEAEGQPVTTMDAEESDPMPNSNQWIYLMLIGLASVFAVWLLKSRGVIFSRKSAGGEVITESRQLSKNEIEDAVKESSIEPDDKLFQKIMKKTVSNK